MRRSATGQHIYILLLLQLLCRQKKTSETGGVLEGHRQKQNAPNAHSNQLTMAVLIEICSGKHPGRRDSPASMPNSNISATTIELETRLPSGLAA